MLCYGTASGKLWIIANTIFLFFFFLVIFAIASCSDDGSIDFKFGMRSKVIKVKEKCLFFLSASINIHHSIRIISVHSTIRYFQWLIRNARQRNRLDPLPPFQLSIFATTGKKLSVQEIAHALTREMERQVFALMTMAERVRARFLGGRAVSERTCTTTRRESESTCTSN